MLQKLSKNFNLNGDFRRRGVSVQDCL
jgi:hypothetical protein